MKIDGPNIKHRINYTLFYKQLQSLKAVDIFNFFPVSNLVNGCLVV